MGALRLSGDRKVAPFMVRNGRPTDVQVLVRNTFGLPAFASCPGATSVCKQICYAARTEHQWRHAIAHTVGRNWEILQAVGDNEDAITALLEELMADFHTDLRRAQRRGVLLPPLFRIHWDGDFYSLPYARAWRRVILAHPEITFWTYTRSFRPPVNVVPLLHGLENLTLYLSVDDDNVRDAKRVLAAHPRLLVSTLADTADEAEDLLSELGRRRAPVCPEVIGRVPLLSARADRRRLPEPGEPAEGACVTCGMCIVGRADVRFPITRGGRKTKAPTPRHSTSASVVAPAPAVARS